jgi:hypothetical protein
VLEEQRNARGQGQENGNRDNERSEDGKPNESGSSASKPPLVPGFGIPDTLAKVPGFDIPLARAGLISIAAAANGTSDGAANNAGDARSRRNRGRDNGEDGDGGGRRRPDFFGPPPEPPSFASPAPSSSSEKKTTTTTSPASDPKPYKYRSPADRLPKGLPSWFINKDKDGDGQVLMAEYATVWTDAVAAEFASRDPSGDGVITPDEVPTSEKEKKK